MALLHLCFEIVQHRQADVRLVEDHDVRRLRIPARRHQLFPQLGDVELSNKVCPA